MHDNCNHADTNVLTETSKKSPILNVNVGGGMNCWGSLASSPPLSVTRP